MGFSHYNGNDRAEKRFAALVIGGMSAYALVGTVIAMVLS